MRAEFFLDKIIVYIYEKKYLDNNIKLIIKNVIKDLNKYYKISIKGEYDLKLYINKIYGMILEIKENNISYENIININLKIINDCLILYEVEDPLDYMDNEIYYYNKKFYVNIKKIDNKLIENSNIVYSSDAYRVIGRGIKIN